MSVPQKRELRTAIPGPRSQELHQRTKQAVSSGVGVGLPVYVEKAGGGIVVDVDGNQLIDLGSGIAVTSVGASAQRVIDRAQAQLEDFTHTCFMVTPYEEYTQVAEKLNELTPAITRSAPRCSTRALRPSRTRSRSPATTPGALP